MEEADVPMEEAVSMSEWLRPKITNFFNLLSSVGGVPVPLQLREHTHAVLQLSSFCGFLRVTRLAEPWTHAIDRLTDAMVEDSQEEYKLDDVMKKAGLAPEDPTKAYYEGIGSLAQCTDFVAFLSALESRPLPRKDILKIGSYMELVGTLAAEALV
jgi:hypothetical protein